MVVDPPLQPTEVVERPPPGTVARGVWEAPAWAFYAALVVVFLAAVLYVLRRRRRRS
jgi:hypothetical protein